MRFGPLVVRASYADFEDLWSPLPTGRRSVRRVLQVAGRRRPAALHDAYRRRLGVGDGPFELTARAWAVAGTVPSGMAGGNADLVRPIYEQWGRGNWVPRFDVYHPRMQWGWSDEFPGLDGVYEDHADPNPRLRAWLSEWEHWRAEAEDYLEIGDHVVVLASYHGRGRGSGVEIQQPGRTSSSCATARWCGWRSSRAGRRPWSRCARAQERLVAPDPMDNRQIADRLDAFASMLELAEANPYTARAYRRAAETIRGAAVPVADLVRSGRARELRGIGPGIEARLRELVETGEIAELAELERELAPDLVGLGRYLGLGAKRSVELARALGIRTAEEFREAAAAGRLRTVPGIGPKTEARLLEALAPRGRAASRGAGFC